MSALESVINRSGVDRAAIMMLLLSEEDAAALLSHLSPDELRQLSARMCTMGEIAPNEIVDAIAGFSNATPDGGIPEIGRVDTVRRLLNGAVGEIKSDSVLRSALPEPDPPQPEPASALGLLQWLEPSIIADLLADEHPQAIAVLLLQVDSEVAAAALALLPKDIQAPVLHRVARLGPVSPQALAVLEDAMSAKLSRLQAAAPLALGGIRQAADIMNRAHKSVEQTVMPTLGKLDKPLARALEEEMFKFDHLMTLDTKMTGVLLREVESDLLIVALRGLELPQREHFFAAMSQRAADGLRDEIESRGRVKRSDIEAAQKQIVGVAKRLIASGDLIMGAGDDDYA
jgi:flagellar motor switch protein FliG